MAKGIQSILLGFRLLRGITDSDTPVSLKSIAAAAGMSPSKARMYLISLIETGLVVQKAETGLYALGPYALYLGTRALQRMELMAVATDAMRDLQHRTNALVLLCTWDVKGIMIVSRSEGNRPQPLQFAIGGSASLASTATGQCSLHSARGANLGPSRGRTGGNAPHQGRTAQAHADPQDTCGTGSPARGRTGRPDRVFVGHHSFGLRGNSRTDLRFDRAATLRADAHLPNRSPPQEEGGSRAPDSAKRQPSHRARGRYASAPKIRPPSEVSPAIW